MKFHHRVLVTTALAGAVLFSLACAAGGSQKREQSEARRYLRMGQLQFEQRKTLLAIESTRKAIGLDPRYVEARNYLGLIYLSTGEYKEAVKHLEEAVRIDPYFTDARNHLGIAYKETGKYDRAFEAFQRALQDSGYPTPEKIHLNLGHLYLAQVRHRDAIQSFKQALAIQPDYLLGILGLGRAYRSYGRDDLAAEAFNRVVRLAPDSQEAARARQLLTGQVKRNGS